jgi:hypothetical protein
MFENYNNRSEVHSLTNWKKNIQDNFYTIQYREFYSLVSYEEGTFEM